MEENLEKNEETQVVWTDTLLLKKLYTSPREAFRYIQETNYSKYHLILLALFGISIPFNSALLSGIFSAIFRGNSQMYKEAETFNIIIWTVFGLGLLFVYSDIFRFIGKIFDGVASADAISKVMAYSSIPLIINIILLIFEENIKSGINHNEGGSFIPIMMYYGIKTLQFVFIVWSSIVLIIGFSEVQKISFLAALLNFLFTNIFIRIVIWAAVSMFFAVHYFL